MAFGVRCPGCFKVPMSITPVSSGRALARMAETGSLLRGAAAPVLCELAPDAPEEPGKGDNLRTGILSYHTLHGSN